MSLFIVHGTVLSTVMTIHIQSYYNRTLEVLSTKCLWYFIMFVCCTILFHLSSTISWGLISYWVVDQNPKRNSPNKGNDSVSIWYFFNRNTHVTILKLIYLLNRYFWKMCLIHSNHTLMVWLWYFSRAHFGYKVFRRVQTVLVFK